MGIFHEAEGRVKYSPPRVYLVFNSRGCNIRFIMHLHVHRISGEKKFDEEGKEKRKKNCSSDLVGFELGAVGL